MDEDDAIVDLSEEVDDIECSDLYLIIAIPEDESGIRKVR